MSKKCSVCNNNLGTFNFIIEITDGYICNKCIQYLSEVLNFEYPPSSIQEYEISQMKSKRILKNLESYNLSTQHNEVSSNKSPIYSSPNTSIVKISDKEFNKKRSIGSDGLYADFTSKQTMISISSHNRKLFSFKDITGYKPTIECYKSKENNEVLRAITGGILFGEVGAIVGAITGGKQYDVISDISITIFLSNGNTFETNMLSSKNKADSWVVKNAKQRLNRWCNLLDRIIKDNNPQIILQSNKFSTADEIKKYNNLFNAGIISKEEFNKKKAKLLNL